MDTFERTGEAVLLIRESQIQVARRIVVACRRTCIRIVAWCDGVLSEDSGLN